MEQQQPKKKYEKPRMTVQKLTPFFFACLKQADVLCTTKVNKVQGSGCAAA